MMGEPTILCPDCRGDAQVSAFVDGPNFRGLRTFDCPRCNGSGRVPLIQAAWRVIGQAHREKRIDRQESLLECSRRLGILPSQLSAMERGTADSSSLKVR